MINSYYVLKESITSRYLESFNWDVLETTADIDQAKVFETMGGIEDLFSTNEGLAFFSEHNANWEIIKMMGVTLDA